MVQTAMSGLLRPSSPCTIVIFGAAGDLTKRKLLPALYNLKANGLLARDFAIVGVTRKDKSHEQFRAEQSKDIAEFATMPVDQALWGELRDALYYQAGEFTDPATYTKLAALLENPTLSNYTGSVQDSGEGRWTLIAAIEEGVPADVLSASLYVRFRSRQEHTFAEKILSAMRQKFGGHIERAAGG